MAPSTPGAVIRAVTAWRGGPGGAPVSRRRAALASGPDTRTMAIPAGPLPVEGAKMVTARPLPGG